MPAYRQRAVTAVARMRSLVSGSEVYRSRGKPQNSNPVDLSTTRSVRPETTQAWSPSMVTSVVLVPPPARVKACPCSAPSTAIRSQPYSWMLIFAPVTHSKPATKCLPRRSANASISPTPYCCAKA